MFHLWLHHSLLVFLLMDIWGISSVWQLWIKLLWTFLFKFSVNMCFDSLGWKLGIELLIHSVWEFCLLTSLPTLDVVNFKNLHNLGGYSNGNPPQYSCLANPMGRGAWWAVVHGVAGNRTRLNDFTFTFHFDALRRKWQPTPVFLPGESQGQGSLVGCYFWGCTESDTTEAT